MNDLKQVIIVGSPIDTIPNTILSEKIAKEMMEASIPGKFERDQFYSSVAKFFSQKASDNNIDGAFHKNRRINYLHSIKL